MKELLLALPAGRETGGKRFGLVPAHMAYRVGPGPRLLGIRLPQGPPRRPWGDRKSVV